MSSRTRSLRWVTLAIGTLSLAAAPYATAQDTAPTQEPRKPWTQGTTDAANEVVGARSGLGFSFSAPPDPDLPELTVSASTVDGLVQVLDIQPPPVPDMPPTVAIRIKLLPPGPTTPARIELHVLDEAAISLFGSDEMPASLCEAR